MVPGFSQSINLVYCLLHLSVQCNNSEKKMQNCFRAFQKGKRHSNLLSVYKRKGFCRGLLVLGGGVVYCCYCWFWFLVLVFGCCYFCCFLFLLFCFCLFLGGGGFIVEVPTIIELICILETVNSKYFLFI